MDLFLLLATGVAVVILAFSVIDNGRASDTLTVSGSRGNGVEVFLLIAILVATALYLAQ